MANSYNTTNPFEVFCYDLFYWFKDSSYDAFSMNKKNILGSKGWEKLDLNSLLKKEYFSIQTDLDTMSLSISGWLANIEKYTSFIRTAEKCFMYQNTDTNNIYAEIIEKDEQNKKIFYYKTNDFKVKITIDQTKIKNPVKSNIALSMIMGETDHFTKIYTIEIVREFGKQMANTFRFISGEDIKIENTSDEVLFSAIMQQINRDILISFQQILKSIITISTGIELYTVDWRDIINDKLWAHSGRRFRI